MVDRGSGTIRVRAPGRETEMASRRLVVGVTVLSIAVLAAPFLAIRTPAASAQPLQAAAGGTAASALGPAATPPGSGRRTRGVARGPQPPASAAARKEKRPGIHVAELAVALEWRNRLGMPEPGENNITKSPCCKS